MSANVYLRQKNGAAETPGPVRIRFKNADNPGIDDNSRLVKPSSGINRSIEKWLRPYMGPWGPTGSITAPILFTDGVNNLGPGVKIYVRTTNPTVYATPGTPANDSAGTDLFTYTVGSPKALDVGNAGPFSTLNADFGDYIVLWMSVDTTVVPPGPGSVREYAIGLELLKFDYTDR